MTTPRQTNRMRAGDPVRRRAVYRPQVDGLEARTLMSLTIEIRYDFDAGGFFAAPERRSAMELAANLLGNSMQDSLTAIEPLGNDVWTATFRDPATGQLRGLKNLVVPQDTMIVYVGGRDLPGSEKGNGGPGGFDASGTLPWLDRVEGRGQPGALSAGPTDTGPWGGAISFDTVGTNWYFGESAAGLGAAQTDFLSVAMHELTHVLGFGIRIPSTVTSWSRLVSGTQFVGANAVAANGSAAVPLDAGLSHWAEGTTSGGREAAMDPSLTQGTRKVLTPLDFAGLKDVGWRVQAPGAVQVAQAAMTVDERDGNLEVHVTRPTGGPAASVRLTTGGGTATPGQDYQPLDVMVSFAPNEVFRTVTIPILTDSLREGRETFQVALSAFNGATPGATTTATVTILDAQSMTAQDFDGNRVSDLGVFAIGPANWNLQYKEADGSSLGQRTHQFGSPADFTGRPLLDVPVPGDYNGDGITDLAVFRVLDAMYFVKYLDADGRVIGSRSFQFGFPGSLAIAMGLEPLVDIPVPGDYNGDGVTDLAVFRVPTAEWIIKLKKPGFDFKDNFIGGPAGNRWIQHGFPGNYAEQLGLEPLIDVPVPGDYNGDGITDLSVYRRTTGEWLHRFNDAAGNRIGGRADAPLWDQTDNASIRDEGNRGIGADFPVPGDYDGNGVTDLALWNTSTAEWRIILKNANGTILNSAADGPSNTRRQTFGTPRNATTGQFTEIPLAAPIPALMRLRVLPGLGNSGGARGASGGRSFSSGDTGSLEVGTRSVPPPSMTLQRESLAPPTDESSEEPTRWIASRLRRKALSV